ncbi:MAG: PilT/PilU family type 4a pilus ATPase [bacterium]|nr:PilT/PilU family type 4a pilus ATPase [bacterium]
MEQISIENEVLGTVVEAMGKSEMLGTLKEDMLEQIAKRAQLQKFKADEIVIDKGDPSETFYMIIKGEVAVLGKHETRDEYVQLGRMQSPATIGEIGLLLEHTRTATIRAITETFLLKFDRAIFNYFYENIPPFALSISKFLAKRVQQLSAKISLPHHDQKAGSPSSDILKKLPMDLIVRHRILPLKLDNNIFQIGFVDDPTTGVMGAIHHLLPSLEIKPVRIKMEMFNHVMETFGGEKWTKAEKQEKKTKTVKKAENKSPRLDTLLKRLVAEGASDLHLAAGQIPYWRIDGEMRPITNAQPLEASEVYELLKPVLNEHNLKEFEEMKDADLAYTIPEVARFRINMYTEDNGISAAIRVIPTTLLTFEQLGLPSAIKTLCENQKGLILVTGPSGSGKTTTLASMVNYVNRTRKSHIITLEDPIEFVHKSRKSLVTQRELGNHLGTFARGLRSGLRQDPDIVLLGEMRDLETIALALEIANTGHLVFATLHTSTAVGTVNRIIDAFPPDRQDQVKTDLSECLKGVLSQNLCKRTHGGRVAAFELLVVNNAIGNMIREGKVVQIPSMMMTGRALGHTFMNESLCQLVTQRKIDKQEAMSKAIDKADLENRLSPAGMEVSKSMKKKLRK